ncbi:helix-turn-helix transcriptional regulator [Macrococcus equipercicus]|uniref:Helix-turn-helix transcriptional regulator n=1 Tax=Macrococcus equipercicus TaxID=69967 RepID=A0ABQ6R7L2_9STAP|nr:helix-turn-helix domain-containing protein [Macrococcus equipercicus]KAA1039078.1 helix-turn-helix transcriptional regulator [Macrococcus equipercicus]
MPISIGDKVIKRRKEVKMTQSELAKDICTQSQVSRIEKNEIMPSSETLFLIANKLNVSMDYFFGVEKLNNTIRGKKICQDYLESREFDTLEVFVDAQLQTIISDYEYRYFNWVKAVCSAYTSKDLLDSIQRLEELAGKDINFKDAELEASIYNSLAIFYRDINELQKADRAIEKAKYIIKSNELYNETAVKVYYQYARLLMMSNDYHRCIEFAQEGITMCLDNNIMYLFDRLLYLYCGAKQDINSISDRDKDLFILGYGLAKIKNEIGLIELYEQELTAFKNLLPKMEEAK